jgi:hypothetical protein
MYNEPYCINVLVDDPSIVCPPVVATVIVPAPLFLITKI